MLQVILSASKKSITRKWLNTTSPTEEDWYGFILDIFKMETLTYTLRNRRILPNFEQID